MSNISATAVKALRDRTNLPMMECKEALTNSAGGFSLTKKLQSLVEMKRAAWGWATIWFNTSIQSSEPVLPKAELESFLSRRARLVADIETGSTRLPR